MSDGQKARFEGPPRLPRARVAVGVVALVGSLFAVAQHEGGPPGRALTLAVGSVWVPWGSAGEVASIDVVTGRLGGRAGGMGVGDLAVAQAGSDAVAVNTASERVFAVDGARQQVRSAEGVAQPGVTDVALAGETAYLASDGDLRPVDPASLADVGEPVPLGPGPMQVDSGQGEVLWALDGAGGRVVAVGDGELVADVDLPIGRGAELAVVDGSAVVVDPATGKMWRVDASSGAVREGPGCASAMVGMGTVGGSPEGSWLTVTDPDAGLVRLVDLAEETCSAPIAVAEPGAVLGEPVEAGGRVYVPVISTGEVVVIDPEASAVVGRGAAGEEAAGLELVVEGDHVVFYVPGSREVGAVGPDGSIRHTDPDPAGEDWDRASQDVTGAVGDGRDQSELGGAEGADSRVPRPGRLRDGGVVPGRREGGGVGGRDPDGGGPEIGPGSPSGPEGAADEASPDPAAPPGGSCRPPEAALSASTGVADINETATFTLTETIAGACEITGVEWATHGPTSKTYPERPTTIELAFDTEGVYEVSATITYRGAGGASAATTSDPAHVSIVIDSSHNPFVGVWDYVWDEPNPDEIDEWVVITAPEPGRVLIEIGGTGGCFLPDWLDGRLCRGDLLNGTDADGRRITVDRTPELLASGLMDATLTLTPDGTGLDSDWKLGQEGSQDCVGFGFTRRGSPSVTRYDLYDADCDGQDDVTSDNCPSKGGANALTANPDQVDSDGDGFGDVCDTSAFLGRWHSGFDSIGVFPAELFSEYDAQTTSGVYLNVGEICPTAGACDPRMFRGMGSFPPGELDPGDEPDRTSTAPDHIRFVLADYRDVAGESQYYRPQIGDATVSADGRTLTVYWSALDAVPLWRDPSDPPGDLRQPAPCYSLVYTQERDGSAAPGPGSLPVLDPDCSGDPFD